VPGTVSYAATTRTVTFTPSSALSNSMTYSVAVIAKDTTGQALASGGTWSFTTAKPDPQAGVCPCGLFTDSTVPSIVEVQDSPVTLGVRFASTTAGSVIGMRFYKSAGNTGTHVGTLWSMSGQQLATGTFTGESTAGWQTLTFTTPVSIAANTDYIVSYRSTTGNYSATPGDFSGAGISKPPLVAGNATGAYSYPDAFPSAGSTTDYLVDVVFATPADPVTVVSESPANGVVGVDPTTSDSITLSSPIASGYSLAVSAGGTAVAGAVSQSADGTTITFTPTAALPAGAVVTATLSGARSTSGSTLATQTWSFTVKAATLSAPTLGDFNSDAHADVVARSSSGALYLYRGNGAGGWLNPPGIQFGSGWNGWTILSPGDFDGDGHNDILARDSAGTLWLYPGNGASGWGAPRQVGSGWNIMSKIIAAHDFNGDGTPDILAVDSAGALWLYPGNGHGGWLARQAIGSGWNGMTAIVGIRDFTGDGNPGLLARDSIGRLWLYEHATTGWKTPIVVGSGWNGITAIASVGDFNGDGHDDILGRNINGDLILYATNGQSGWKSQGQVGSGWNGMTWIG
jgi:hypothetical protein